MEGFARAVARLAATGPPRPEDVVALASAHGIAPVDAAAPAPATRR
jgi:hypothetical protein